MTAKPKMTRDEVIKRLAFVRKIVAGMPEEDVVESAIALLQSQPDTKGQRVGEDIEEILKFHLTSEHGWHFDAPYPGYSFDPVKIIAHALAARLAVPKIDRERLAKALHKRYIRPGYEGVIKYQDFLKDADAIIAELEGER